MEGLLTLIPYISMDMLTQIDQLLHRRSRSEWRFYSLRILHRRKLTSLWQELGTKDSLKMLHDHPHKPNTAIKPSK